jgi:hypothetical protein
VPAASASQYAPHRAGAIWPPVDVRTDLLDSDCFSSRHAPTTLTLRTLVGMSDSRYQRMSHKANPAIYAFYTRMNPSSSLFINITHNQLQVLSTFGHNREHLLVFARRDPSADPKLQTTICVQIEETVPRRLKAARLLMLMARRQIETTVILFAYAKGSLALCWVIWATL